MEVTECMTTDFIHTQLRNACNAIEETTSQMKTDLIWSLHLLQGSYSHQNVLPFNMSYPYLRDPLVHFCLWWPVYQFVRRIPLYLSVRLHFVQEYSTQTLLGQIYLQFLKSIRYFKFLIFDGGHVIRIVPSLENKTPSFVAYSALYSDTSILSNFSQFLNAFRSMNVTLNGMLTLSNSLNPLNALSTTTSVTSETTIDLMEPLLSSHGNSCFSLLLIFPPLTMRVFVLWLMHH